MNTDYSFAVPHDLTTLYHARVPGLATYRYELKHRSQLSMGDFFKTNIGRQCELWLISAIVSFRNFSYCRKKFLWCTIVIILITFLMFNINFKWRVANEVCRKTGHCVESSLHQRLQLIITRTRHCILFSNERNMLNVQYISSVEQRIPKFLEICYRKF